MLTAIIKKAHFFIIGWTIYTTYEGWVAYEEKFNRVKAQIPGKINIFKRKKKELAQLRSYFNDVETAKKRMSIVASEIEKLQQQLPAKISDTDNLALLSKTAKDVNIKDVYLSPGREELKGFYYTKKYKFKGVGTYLQFLIFFEKLAEEERILNVNTVTLQENNKKQRGRFRVINVNVEIETYRYNSKFKEDTGISKIEKKLEIKNK